ncbi:MAG: SDR family NAD(P)-dependent oxidoreductase [Oceanicaulis sp.]
MGSPRPAKPKDGIAWVTGASSGIGEALTRKLVKKGWRVAISARSADKLQALAAEAPDQIIPVPLDITDADAVKAAVEKIEAEHGPIVRAVLNAGIYISINAETPDFSDYAKTFTVNLNGTAACVSAIVPRFVERRGGQLVIVSSATAFGGMPTASAYGATKAALLNMAECLRIELHRYGVLVQCVTPGFVETPAQDDNEFPKPFMISPEKAANRMFSGMTSSRFEVTFPRRFTWMLKAIYALPRSWHIGIVRKQTGWDKPID